MTAPFLAKRPAPPDNQDDESLALAIIAAFLLTDAQVAAMAAAIYAARIAAYRANYLATAAALGATVPEGWQPDATVRADMRAQAEASADSIAATYQRDLTAAALAFLAAWRAQHDGSLAGAGPALRTHLHGWARARAGWKSEQVSNAEAGSGANDGVDSAIGDTYDGALLDANGDPLNPDAYVVAIVPDDAAEPFCADYAGNVYDLDQYDELPSFPAHPSCIHEKWVIPAP